MDLLILHGKCKENKMPSTAARRKKQSRTANLRYAIYARCSTDDQTHQDFSTIDNQREKNRTYVMSKGGIVFEEYIDEGLTGTNLNRRGWKRLLDDAQEGKFDVVVITLMSRLGRGNAYTLAEFMLMEAGVRIEFSEESFADDEGGYIQKQVTNMLNGLYPLQVAKNTKVKMSGMVGKGYVTGNIPFGYMKESTEKEFDSKSGKDKRPPQIMVPHSDHAPLVRQAFLMARDSCTRAAIEQYLQLTTGQRWTTTRVKTLLMNEAYIGIQNFGAWRNEEAHEPIVERELFDAVQEIVAVPPTRPPRGTTKAGEEDPYRYYLRGRVHCPHCETDQGEKGCVYTQASAGKSGTHYYVCLRDNKGETKCPVGRLNADALHFTVLSLIERAAHHHTVMSRLISESDSWQTPAEDMKRLRGQLGKQLQSVGSKKENLLRALEDGRGATSVLSRLDAIEKEEAELREKITTADQDIEASTLVRPTADVVMASWGSVLEVWCDLDEDEKTELVSSLVEKVVVIAKDRVILQLSPIAELHGQLLAINSLMGAGFRNCTIRPNTLRLRLSLPKYRKTVTCF